MIENKIKGLLKAFKAAKDNNKRTGAAPCVMPFMDQMEELFGHRPSISSTHALNVSIKKNTIPLPVVLNRSITPAVHEQEIDYLEQPAQDTSDISTSNNDYDTTQHTNTPSTSTIVDRGPSPARRLIYNPSTSSTIVDYDTPPARRHTNNSATSTIVDRDFPPARLHINIPSTSTITEQTITERDIERHTPRAPSASAHLSQSSRTPHYRRKTVKELLKDKELESRQLLAEMKESKKDERLQTKLNVIKEMEKKKEERHNESQNLKREILQKILENKNKRHEEIVNLNLQKK